MNFMYLPLRLAAVPSARVPVPRPARNEPGGTVTLPLTQRARGEIFKLSLLTWKIVLVTSPSHSTVTSHAGSLSD